MTLTQFKARLRQYRYYIAFGALALFIALVVGVIYYIRQAQQPLAPTAPTSKPSAQENVCTTGFTVEMECKDIKPVGGVAKGQQVSFVCDSATGEFNAVDYRYRTSPDGEWTKLPTQTDSNNLASEPVTVGDYLQVLCSPCLGQYCATYDSISQNCVYKYEYFPDELQCIDLTSSADLEKGKEVSFTCSEVEGADGYRFVYRTTPDEKWKELYKGPENQSPAIEVGDYLDVFCTPCDGERCFAMREQCEINYEFEYQEPLQCIELTSSADLEKGKEVSFTCSEVEGADSYRFVYRTSPDEEFKQLYDGPENQSPAIEVGDYLDVFCAPCVGDRCYKYAEQCELNYEYYQEPLQCIDLTSSADLEKGKEVSFTCSEVEGADSYRFVYRTSPDEEFKQLYDGPENQSPAIEVGDYLDVFCAPCVGDRCYKYAEQCEVNYEFEEDVTPQCNSQCVNSNDCPADLTCSDGFCRNPECTSETDCTCPEVTEEETAGFVIEKYNDLDGDGSRDEGEPGLDWEFEWDKNGDENWREYVTYAEENGRGGNVDDLEPGDVIRIDEQPKDGWEATTDTDRTLTLQEGKRLLAQFGNWQPPAEEESTPEPEQPAAPTQTNPTPTPTPTELPKSGTTSQTVSVLGAGVFILLLGIYKLYQRRGL